MLQTNWHSVGIQLTHNFFFFQSFVRLAIWTGNNNKQKVLSIGKKLRESLNLPPELQIQYELHKETAFKHGGKAVAYTL